MKLPRKTKNRTKGFTLVELIVVLVILAILAALLVPALTGYINRAKRQTVIANGRAALMAAQSINAEFYANDTPGDPDPADVLALAEVPGEIVQMEFVDHILQTTEDTPFMYQEGPIVAMFKDGVWSIEDDASDPGSAPAPAGGFMVDDSVTNPAVKNFFMTGWDTVNDGKGNAATYKTFTASGEIYCLAWYTGKQGNNKNIKDAIKLQYPTVKDIEIKHKGQDQNNKILEKLSDSLGTPITSVYFDNDTGKLKVSDD